MRNMYRKILPREVLQELDWEEFDRWMVEGYQRQTSRYLEDRKRIPEGRLFEIRYEELDERPVEVLRQLYAALDLPGLERALPEFERYLSELGTFEKNRFGFPAEAVEAVNQHWGFALDAFRYARIHPGEVPR